MPRKSKSSPSSAPALPPNARVTIMRRPCLPEDEGHHQFIMSCKFADAEAWISAQKGQYFFPSDYYITQVLRGT
jgi:hypothetical protein